MSAKTAKQLLDEAYGMKKRVIINLTFSADLDMVPGWGHEAKDWVDLVKRELERNSHYNTDVLIHTVHTVNKD